MVNRLSLLTCFSISEVPQNALTASFHSPTDVASGAMLGRGSHFDKTNKIGKKKSKIRK